jgi:hypothetical protein
MGRGGRAPRMHRHFYCRTASLPITTVYETGRGVRFIDLF